MARGIFGPATAKEESQNERERESGGEGGRGCRGARARGEVSNLCWNPFASHFTSSILTFLSLVLTFLFFLNCGHHNKA